MGVLKLKDAEEVSEVELRDEEKSVAEDCRLDLPVVRLNICGTRARDSEEGMLPSGGCSC